MSLDADRLPDHNGWYNSAVSFTTHGTDATSGLVGCDLPVTYFAPDTAAGTLSGSCSDAAGNTATSTATFKYDSTAPTASATPDSQPNVNGWYRTPLNVSFDDMTDLAQGFGFHLARVNGSHHIYSRRGIPELVNLQEVSGKAKPYQVRQFLKLVERYNLKLEDEQ